MFKGSENKAAVQPVPNVFTHDTYGAVSIHRSELEDPRRSGHLLEGLLLDPAQWAAAQAFGLLTPNGRRIGFTEVQRDPLTPIAAEAPPALLRELAAAETAFAEANSKITEAMAARVMVEAKKHRAIKQEDARAFNAAVAEEIEALAAYGLAVAGVTLPRVRYASAEAKLHRWLRLEESTRREAARR